MTRATVEGSTACLGQTLRGAVHEFHWHIGCKVEFKPRVRETPRPLQARVPRSGGRPTAGQQHVLGVALCDEHRGPDLKHRTACEALVTTIGLDNESLTEST